MKVYLDNLRLRFVPCYDIEGPVPVDTYDMQRYLSWREDFMMMSPLGSIGTLMIHGEGNSGSVSATFVIIAAGCPIPSPIAVPMSFFNLSAIEDVRISTT